MNTIQRIILTVASLALPLRLAAQKHESAKVSEPWPTSTFSILAYDPATGELGGAVQSRVFSVGNGVLWAEADVGVVATQAIVDVSYGPQALALLRQGMDAEHVVMTVWDKDPNPRPDDNPGPIKKLRRLVEKAAAQRQIPKAP